MNTEKSHSETIYINGPLVSPPKHLEYADASFSEMTNGSIDNQKNADFTVLSDDPKTSPKDRLGDLRPIMTLVGGIIKWESPN